MARRRPVNLQSHPNAFCEERPETDAALGRILPFEGDEPMARIRGAGRAARRDADGRIVDGLEQS